jgi:hypothetical protein
MVRINRAKIKQGLKTTAKTAGILAISGAVGIGSYNVADRISRQKVFNEINDPEKVSGPIGVILERASSKNAVVFRKSGLYTWSVFLK